MALIDDVKQILDKLAPRGWQELFEAHGLNITADNLERELSKNLEIDRTFPGFRDFTFESRKGITPGKPAYSLLFHGLASPNVLWTDKAGAKIIRRFPTLKEIDIVENYIYSKQARTIRSLVTEHGLENMAVVVFANQYRTAIDTPHKAHADVVFSRTGVARIGTERAWYDKKNRSFRPDSNKPTKVKVQPAKYNAYLAVRQNGNVSFLGRRLNPDMPVQFSNVPRDENLNFWVPIHKLFSGTECLKNETLDFNLDCEHTNEKIGKIHKFISGELSLDTGSEPSERNKFPFKFNNRIARFDKKRNLVVPVIHKTIVEKAKKGQKTFALEKSYDLPVNVNGNQISLFSSSLEMRTSGRANLFSPGGRTMYRSTPEYAHIRTSNDNGVESNLNQEPEIENYLANENFDALHYVDFAGDGYVRVEFKENTFDFSNWLKINAYSIVAPPDYFPYCDQVELFDSLEHREIWSLTPRALCDMRILPNVQSHPELIFEGMGPTDTCTALVCMNTDQSRTPTTFETRSENRVSYLTDAAAGIFAPGWDTSFDRIPEANSNIPHLAAYGLGSPFPEDAKLCAALSSFWPAVAPDVSRSFWPTRKTVLPMTDEEIGSGDTSGWDGEHGPIIKTAGDTTIVEYKLFEYVDYTINAFENKFNYNLLYKIDSQEYLDRVNRYAVALERAGENSILISFTKEGNDFIFRFARGFSRLVEKQDKMEAHIAREITLRVDPTNQIVVA